jgi:hypothetical protein
VTREQLAAENAALRDLLAAVSECARSVPQAAVGEPSWKEHSRARNVLITLGVITDPDGTWTWSWGSGQGAAHLRERAAEPAGYEVYVKPEDDALRAEMTGEGAAVADAFCPDAYTAPGVEYYCTLKAGHKGLHAQLTSTGAFIAEWGYPDGHVHTTAEIPAVVSA